MRYPKDKKRWSTSYENKFWRLVNSVGRRIKKTTKIIKFVKNNYVPNNRQKDITYESFVCNVWNKTAEKNRTRFVVDGDRINYPGEVATPTSDMLVAKLLLESVLSTRGAKFMTMDISNFYQMTPLKRPAYIRIIIKDIPEEIITEYKLRDKADADGSA